MYTLDLVIGAKANNDNGEFLGNIAGTMHNAAGDVLEYIVLKSNHFFGRGERYFAVPAQSPLIDAAENGKIIIHLKRDDLQFARGISANNCPEPNLKYGLSVFELYSYDEEQPEAFTTNLLDQKETTKRNRSYATK